MLSRRSGWLAASLAALVCAGVVSGDQIRLKDGTEVSGAVLQQNGEDLIVRLSRHDVASVYGRPLPPPVTEGELAPEFSVVDVAGNRQSLTQYRGRVTLVKFWATWCPYCRSDLPLMKTLFGKYHDRGLQILGISIDDDGQALRDFLRKDPLPYPVIEAAEYPELPLRYEADGVPAYFLVGEDGRIVRIWRGSVTKGQADLEDVLTRLLS
jgi:peroxiredoxin